MKTLVSLVLFPLGTAFALIALAVFLGWALGRRRAALLALISGLGWLWLWSTPIASDALKASLEQQFPMRGAEEMPVVDAIVVLGGAFSHQAGWVAPDLSGSADRYWHAARLFHAGRAPIVIVSGGRMPGRGPGLSEAEAGAIFLQDLGVPRGAIVLEMEALTTRGNATAVRALLDQRAIERILLVTSALHMRRSMAAFRAVGLDPLPAATDFEVRSGARLSPASWLPSASALVGSTRAFHEYIGFIAYRLRGWV